MLWTVENVIGDLVLSKGESAYSEVIETFGDTESVTVVTYNLSQNQTGLLSALRAVQCEVRLITKIPNRYTTYTSAWARRRGADSIEAYLGLLEPEKFGPLARTLFCFGNHAKIVMTDSVGYVGSANFSEESADSWEAGIIVRDPAVLSQVAKLADEIEKDSVRYYGRAMGKHVAPLLAARERMEELSERLAEDFTTADMEDLDEVISELRGGIERGDRAWAAAFEKSGPICSRIDMDLMDSLEDWFGARLSIWNLGEATQRYQAAMDGDIDAGELPTNSDGDILESAQDALVDDMYARQQYAESTVAREVAQVRNGVGEICRQIEAVCKEIGLNIGKIKNI